MATVGWSSWKTKNDQVFSNIVIKTPKQVAYKSMKQWTKLSKNGSMKESLVEKLKEVQARW
jgi:hypothetical protein